MLFFLNFFFQPTKKNLIFCYILEKKKNKLTRKKQGQISRGTNSFRPFHSIWTHLDWDMEDFILFYFGWVYRRGLSKHYIGKSQSFTSLSNVRCLEDLAKPENPYTKKLKSIRSYGGGLMLQESRHGSSLKKATSRGGGGSSSSSSSYYYSSSHSVRRNQSSGGFLGSNRRIPPVPPPSHRSSSSSSSTTTNFATQTPLFALGI